MILYIIHNLYFYTITVIIEDGSWFGKSPYPLCTLQVIKRLPSLLEKILDECTNTKETNLRGTLPFKSLKIPTGKIK